MFALLIRTLDVPQTLQTLIWSVKRIKDGKITKNNWCWDVKITQLDLASVI